MDLPYGENPHQRAAFYTQVGARRGVLIARAPAARQAALVQQHPRPRRRPRGARRARRRARRVRDRQAQQPVRRRRSATTALDAYRKAFAGDPVSAFGGDHRAQPHGRPARSREALSKQFIEVLIAPGYDEDALELLTAEAERAHPRGRGAPPRAQRASSTSARSTAGMLVQDRDVVVADRAQMEVVTDARADRRRSGATCCSPGRVCRHVKSNAIVVAQGEATLGIGAGQMSRVDSVRIAIEPRVGRRAARASCSPPTRSSRSPTARARRSTAASRALIQPGGSIRDHEVIAAVERARRGDGLHPPPPLPPLEVRGLVAPGATVGRACGYRGRHARPTCVAGIHDPARRASAVAAIRAPADGDRNVRVAARRGSRVAGYSRVRRAPASAVLVAGTTATLAATARSRGCSAIRRAPGAVRRSRTSHDGAGSRARRRTLGRRRAHADVRDRHLPAGRRSARGARRGSSAPHPPVTTTHGRRSRALIDPRMLVEIEAERRPARGAASGTPARPRRSVRRVPQDPAARCRRPPPATPPRRSGAGSSGRSWRCARGTRRRTGRRS